MFTIDLLKGEGVPERSGPERVIVTAAAFALPAIVAIIMFGIYLSDSIAISVRSQEIANYERKTKDLSHALEMKESFEREKNAIGDCLSEVSSSVGWHTQWTPVLTTVVQSMPDSMVLTRLEVDRLSVRRKVPQKDDPKKMVDATVPVTTLRISVSGRPDHDYEKAVRDFRDRLRFSNVLGPKIQNIRIARDVGELDGQEVVSYELNCIFKSGV